MRRLVIIDLGSNTSRLVVFAYEPGDWFRLVDQIREPVRLGESLGNSNKLSDAAVQRAVAVLEMFAEFCRSSDLNDVEVVATSAVRDAVNRESLLNRIRDTGLEVRTLSGEAEAEFGVLAVANSMEMDDSWVLDLGGGSLQISLMERRTCVFGRSFPLGAVRMTEAALKSDPPRRSEIKTLEKILEREVSETVEMVRQNPIPLVAMGGTIRNLARAVQRSKKYPLNRRDGYFLQKTDLDDLTDRLLARSARKRAHISGIHPDRADIIVAGALVYRWLLEKSGRQGLYVSGQGLREGAFYRRFLSEPHLLDDIRGFSVRNIFSHYPQPGQHTRQVRRLAGMLFDELQSLHKLGPRDRELLDAAAMLHDVGMAVGYHNHHKHGAYLIETAPMYGFTHREHALLILLVRYHRKGLPNWGSFRTLARLDDASRLSGLTACLRLAEYLERSRSGRIKGLRTEINSNKVRLSLLATEEPLVEIWEARKHAPLFKRAFGKKLVLTTELID